LVQTFAMCTAARNTYKAAVGSIKATGNMGSQ